MSIQDEKITFYAKRKVPVASLVKLDLEEPDMKKQNNDYIKRMHDELSDLNYRIEKLKAFYSTRKMHLSPDFTWYLLKKQLKQMKSYRETLKLRIKYEESEAKEHEDASH